MDEKNEGKIVIAFYGASATGKTTLVTELLKVFLEKFDFSVGTVPSVSRNKAKEGKKINDQVDNETQMRITFENVANILSSPHQVVICERFLLDNLAYAMLSKKIDSSVIKIHENFISWFFGNVSGLTIIPFYIPIEFPAVSDGVRKISAHYQQQVDEEIKNIFQRHKINFFLVKGTIQKRISMVAKVLHNYGIYL